MADRAKVNRRRRYADDDYSDSEDDAGVVYQKGAGSRFNVNDEDDNENWHSIDEPQVPSSRPRRPVDRNPPPRRQQKFAPSSDDSQEEDADAHLPNNYHRFEGDVDEFGRGQMTSGQQGSTPPLPGRRTVFADDRQRTDGRNSTDTDSSSQHSQGQRGGRNAFHRERVLRDQPPRGYPRARDDLEPKRRDVSPEYTRPQRERGRQPPAQMSQDEDKRSGEENDSIGQEIERNNGTEGEAVGTQDEDQQRLPLADHPEPQETPTPMSQEAERRSGEENDSIEAERRSGEENDSIEQEIEGKSVTEGEAVGTQNEDQPRLPLADHPEPQKRPTPVRAARRSRLEEEASRYPEYSDLLDGRGPPRRHQGRRTRQRYPENRMPEGSFEDDPENGSRGYSSLPPRYAREDDDVRNPYDNGPQIVSPQTLVRALGKCLDFQGSLLHLVERCNLHPVSVRQVVSENSHVFTIKQDTVFLQPKIGLCQDHFGPSGCRRRLDCSDIHMCPRFIVNQCSEINCVFGHMFKTNHNLRNLNLCHLDHLSSSNLRRLFKNSAASVEMQGEIDICRDYNDGKCERINCDALHICGDYITGRLNCPKQQCRLNHNLLSQESCWLLSRYGIDTNETPRDLLATLLELNPTLGVVKDLSTETSSENLESASNGVVSTQTSTDISNEQSNQGARTNDTGLDDIDTSSDSGTDDTNSQYSSASEALISSDSETDQLINNESNISNSINVRTEATTSTSTLETSELQIDSSSFNIVSSVGDPAANSETHQSTSPNIDSTNVNTNTAVITSESDVQAPITVTTSVMASESNVPAPVTLTTSEPSRQSENIPIVRSPSLWSHHLEGDVRMAEICYDSVESTCPREDFSCARLHSRTHYHWQVSEESYSWLNLQPSQVVLLERSFCNPGLDTVTLLALVPGQVEASMSILLLLMGQETWTANFEGMILSNSEETRFLYLRRLSTEIIPGITVEPSIYRWFFCDSNDVWTEYGDESLGEGADAGYVNSEAIECQYMINPYSYAQFTVSQCEYILDFNTMIQTSLVTQAECKVRRRPNPHLPGGGEEPGHVGVNLLSTSAQLLPVQDELSSDGDSSD